VRPLRSSRVSNTDRVLLVGNVAYADAVAAAFPDWRRVTDPDRLRHAIFEAEPSLIVVAGWRHLIPADIVRRYPCVGFHSAKLPEYPGRAPVPWTLLRGDKYAWNTMFYLDEGVDTGDIIDADSTELYIADTPDTIYHWIGLSTVALLRRHLDGLLAGTAPRQPQDMTRRGPLTTSDGWQVYESSR